MTLARLVIAGTHSGVGKTTVTLGLMAAFRRQGLVVQGFKVGPDYIDPGFHRVATGRVSRNLDTWMLSEGANREIFTRAASNADISVVEGVMGLFDGAHSTSEAGSTAHVAKVIQAPVVLVVDAGGMARSAAALCLGFRYMDPELQMAGVIFNRVGNPRHYELLKEAVESAGGVQSFGYIPNDTGLTISERHLGLKTAAEYGGLEEFCSRAAAVVEKTVDLDGLIRLAQSQVSLPLPSFYGEAEGKGSLTPGAGPSCTIGVAWDEAFQFYYPDNLELLERAGARIVKFSPLRDTRLPRGLDALYIGGGYPEIHARKLSENRPFIMDLRDHLANGIPCFAECGGMLYLCKEIVDHEGASHPMVGFLSAKGVMGPRIAALGYRQVTAAADVFFLPPGQQARGHEFHYGQLEEVEPMPAAFLVTGRRGQHLEGFAVGSVVASWVHLHFGSNLDIPAEFVKAAVRYHGIRCGRSA